ncbi:MAG: hypothetical protein RBG13Loki_0956 [Promethearchaeota archaeon CR_4]|nr:MAG: hypothetical protein RBG13Loki_0956 [Candidatus Lokiarchaeota archaeon CR_4]
MTLSCPGGSLQKQLEIIFKICATDENRNQQFLTSIPNVSEVEGFPQIS